MHKHIYGINAINELVKNRAEDVISIWFDKNPTGKKSKIKQTLDTLNIPFVIKRKQDFIKLMPKAVNHQGIVAFIKKDIEYKDENWLLKEVKEHDKYTILVLDSVTDPQNFGAIIRSAVAFNVTTVIVGKHNNAPISASAYKSAAGAMEYINIVKVNNINNIIQKLKRQDFWVYALATKNNAQDIKEINFTKKNVLVAGSEGAGIRPLILQNCDFFVKITIKQNIESLNVSVACAIAFYQLKRQLSF
jgi:23S rRNA (guanosine2251-2'-O)-methyltransferase